MSETYDDPFVFTDPAQLVIDNSREAAGQLHHSEIGTEDFLLGLLNDKESAFAKALFSFEGATLEAVRARVAFRRGQQYQEPQALLSVPFSQRMARLLQTARRLSLKDGRGGEIDIPDVVTAFTDQDGGMGLWALKDVGVRGKALKDRFKKELESANA